jgi:hypothetical protein
MVAQMFHAYGFGPWICKLQSKYVKYKITNEVLIAEVQKASSRWNKIRKQPNFTVAKSL